MTEQLPNCPECGSAYALVCTVDVTFTISTLSTSFKSQLKTCLKLAKTCVKLAFSLKIRLNFSHLISKRKESESKNFTFHGGHHRFLSSLGQ